MTERPRVLHVLPHPGGGGETYVDYLCRMGGYRFEKVFVAPGPTPSPRALIGALRAQVASRRYDLLHAHGEVASGLCLPSLALQPSVVTINGLHLVRRLTGWKRSVAEANLRLIVRAASATICVGHAELADVRAVVGNSKRLALVHNGVDASALPTADDRAAVRTELGLRPTDVVGVYLAALDPHKEPLVAAHAARQVAADEIPLVLLFAGDGPLRAELQSIASGGPAIRLLGFRPDPRRVLAAADFFVLPSRREGLSFALLEAMSHGLPPVVSDAPGNTDAIGDAGIVVPGGDVAAFAAAFRRLALDESARRSLGTGARERALTQFSLAEMLRRTGSVYDRVLGSGGHPRDPS